MLYAATIFLSSFLLFLVQPLIARLILPWFGGSAAVWIDLHAVLPGAAARRATPTRTATRDCRQALRARSCITALLLGRRSRRCRSRRAKPWKPLARGAGDPHPAAARRERRACRTSCWRRTSPLLQAWFAARAAGRESLPPVRRCRTSASLIALIGYPFVVEPYLGGARAGAPVWSWLFRRLRASLCAVDRRGWTSAASRSTARSEQAALGTEQRDYMRSGSRSRPPRPGAAARGDQPPDAERRRRCRCCWLAPLTLYLADLHHRLRRQELVPAAVALGRFMLGVLGAMGWLLVDHATTQFDPVDPARGVPCRACSSAACSATASSYRLRPAPRAPHLPSTSAGVRRRRARRAAGGGGRAARLQRLLRASASRSVALARARCAAHCAGRQRCRLRRPGRAMLLAVIAAQPTTASAQHAEVSVAKCATTACCA